MELVAVAGTQRKEVRQEVKQPGAGHYLIRYTWNEIKEGGAICST
jgi:hypothetical protein